MTSDDIIHCWIRNLKNHIGQELLSFEEGDC